MATKRRTVRVYTKSVDLAARTVEQVVSVFDNVDLAKDRVKQGAFTQSLIDWAASGDPIPVIWSHMWDDPFAHIGYCIDAKELGPGDPLLADTPIADLGGLWTRYKVDDAPFANQVLQLLAQRRVREASFAYDVRAARPNPDGTTDLIVLDLIEVGPTLKGMNPMTQLLDVKNLTAALVGAGIDATAAEHAAKAALDAPPVLADGAKAEVMLTGSIEEVLDAYHEAAERYARIEGLGNGGLYHLWCEGTFPAEQRAVYMVEGWDDPCGEGPYYEFQFSTNADGELVVDSATEVVITATITAKSTSAWRTSTAAQLGKAAHRAIGGADASPAKAIGVATVTDNGDDHDRSKGKAAEDPTGKATEDPESGSRPGSGTEPLTTLLDIEALAAGITG